MASGAFVTLAVVTNLGDHFDLAVEPTTTVEEIRSLVREMSSKPSPTASEENTAVKLSVRGAQLVDDAAEWQQLPLDHSSIANGERLFAFISENNRAKAAPVNIPLGAANVVGGAGGGGTAASRRDHDDDDRAKARMMEPMIDAMSRNPQFFDTMLSMQPELQKLIREHPQMEQELRNPETIKQMMMSQIDPDQRRQLNQSMQLQMAQISNTPGGSAMLERYVHGALQPRDGTRGASDLNDALEAHARPDPSLESNRNALPNPWQQPTVQHAGAASMAVPPRLHNTTMAGGSSGSTPWAPAFAAPDAANPFLTMLQQLASNRGQAPPLPSHAAHSASMSGASVGQPASASAAAAPDYSDQLVVLLEMGFEDEALCVEALAHCHGDVDAAVCYIAEKQETQEEK